MTLVSKKLCTMRTLPNDVECVHSMHNIEILSFSFQISLNAQTTKTTTKKKNEVSIDGTILIEHD